MNLQAALLAVHDLRALGVEVWTAAGKVRFRPRSAVPAALLARMAASKVEILELLAAGVRMDSLPGVGPPRRPCRCCRGCWFFSRPGALKWICARCHPPGDPDAMDWSELPRVQSAEPDRVHAPHRRAGVLQGGRP